MLNKATQMDFIRIIRSLEEFLYEVMTWLVFYPRTFLRTALCPVEVLEYSRAELRKPEDEQYQDTLSAPLFLMLSLVISHLIELAVRLHPFQGVGGLSERLFASDQNLIIVRSLMFAVFPLMFALEQVKNAGAPLTRKTLRGPFFGECYPASVFCLLVGVGGTVTQAFERYAPIGVALMVSVTLWYLGLQIVWLKRFNAGWGRATFLAILCFLKAAAVMIFAASAITLSS